MSLIQGLSHRATDHEFNVNEPTTYIKWGLSEQKRTYNKVRYWSDDKNVTRDSEELGPVFPLETAVEDTLNQGIATARDNENRLSRT